jgi:hypothetical protein
MRLSPLDNVLLLTLLLLLSVVALSSAVDNYSIVRQRVRRPDF